MENQNIESAIVDEIKQLAGNQLIEKKTINWGSKAITIILAVLVIVSIAQTVQSVVILNKIKSGDFKTSGSKTVPQTDLQNLPNMVGGC